MLQVPGGRPAGPAVRHERGPRHAVRQAAPSAAARDPAAPAPSACRPRPAPGAAWLPAEPRRFRVALARHRAEGRPDHREPGETALLHCLARLGVCLYGALFSPIPRTPRSSPPGQAKPHCSHPLPIPVARNFNDGRSCWPGTLTVTAEETWPLRQQSAGISGCGWESQAQTIIAVG